jgi:pimeloyl-ACP methyl ester carboxylesterase
MASSINNRRRFLQCSAVAAAGVAIVGGRTQVTAQTPMASPAAAGMLGNPADRQGQMVQVNGASIFVQQSGQGEPMLLIHGYPLSGALFSRVRDGLAAHYQVITIDQRGYGKSQAPGIPNTIATYAQDALAVLDQLGVKQAIIGGHSMGGPVTLAMYQQAPDRFRGMILIDTVAAPASPIEAGLWQGFVTYVQQNGMDQMYIANLMKNMLTGKTRMEQADQVTYLSEVVQAASKDAAIGGAQALATRPDATPILGTIKTPTLVFVGLDDPLYPFEIATMMHQAIANSTLAIIPGGAHAAIFEVPDASTQAILDWASGIK